MSDPLSILDAAAECGSAPALRIGEDSFTFDAVAQRVRDRMRDLAHERAPYPLLADNTLDSVVTLYALLELRVPILVVDPRFTPSERETLLERARAIGPVQHPDAAAIVYTSGTTGEARGAVLARSAFIASAAASAANLGWQDDDCWLACMPIARIGGLSILTRCLIARRCVALATRFDIERLPGWIEQYGVTLTSLVPTMLKRLLDVRASWRPPRRLRAVLVGGAAASPSLLRHAAERGVPIVVTYGCTETCSQVVATPYAHRHAAAEFAAGVPLPNAEVRVVDGRIQARGPMLMAGYWNEPPLAAGAWIDTGDVGEIDARGCLHVLGRRNDLIVTGGDNVYPAEVERVLEDHPGIAAAAVFGVADETWGETVAAALVATHAYRSEAELGDWISERLAPHKRPRRVCFVERLPQTPQGKLDREALRKLTDSLRPLNVSGALQG